MERAFALSPFLLGMKADWSAAVSLFPPFMKRNKLSW